MTLKEIHARLVTINELCQKKATSPGSGEDDWVILEEVFNLRNEIFDAHMAEKDDSVPASPDGGDG